jgi:hypothetical protein
MPALAAAPIGFFDGRGGTGNAGFGMLGVTGWALDDNGIASVDIVIDDQVVQRAAYGVRRPDVTRRKPGFPDSNAPGFQAVINTTHFMNGKHTMSVLVTSNAGEQVVIGPVRAFVFRNASHMLAPFGDITFPQQDAEMRGRCTADPTRRLSVITGNALDAGSGENAHDYGVAYVELLIDGAIAANTLNNCLFNSDPSVNMLLNCYGLPTPALTTDYPTLRNSDRAKFRFALDVGALIASNTYFRGHHTLTIRAGDYGDNAKNIDTVNVFFSCDNEATNEKSIGKIEQPNISQPWFGNTILSGWAIDFQGVSVVELLVDGRVVGTATPTGPRPDVAELYPGYPSVISSGWVFTFDTRTVADGQHTFEVRVRDPLGDETLIGEGLAIVDNRDHP